MVAGRVLPLRLLDCFGFVTPSPFAVGLFDALVVVDVRLAALLMVGFVTVGVGLVRNADGEGILIVAMKGDGRP